MMQAVVRVEEERVQIYEALKKQTSAPVRLSFYEQFKIPPASRKKKRRVRHIQNVYLLSLLLPWINALNHVNAVIRQCYSSPAWCGTPLTTPGSVQR